MFFISIHVTFSFQPLLQHQFSDFFYIEVPADRCISAPSAEVPLTQDLVIVLAPKVKREEREGRKDKYKHSE